MQPLNSRHWFWPFQSCPANNGWHSLSTAKQTDAESAADKVLAPTNTAGGVQPRLTSPFTSTSDYVYIGGYEKNPNGGCLFSWGRHKVYLPYTRGTHYVIVTAQPVLPVTVPAGAAPPKPAPDTSKPITYVVLERNLGSLHEPQVDHGPERTDHLRHHLQRAAQAGQGHLGPPGGREAGGGRRPAARGEGRSVGMRRATERGV